MAIHLLEKIHAHQDACAEATIKHITAPEWALAVVSGTMYGGKTNVSTQVYNATNRIRGFQNAVFKLDGDTRGDIPIDQVWARGMNGNFMHACQIRHINQALSMLGELKQSGVNICTLVEAPFMGDYTELSDFIHEARRLNISLVVDGLSTWFTGKRILPMNAFIEQATLTHIMRAYDCFDPRTYAEFHPRFVSVSLAGEILHDDAYYYRGLSRRKVMKLVDRFQDSQFGERLLANAGTIFLPSHPNDKGFAIGNDRYIPTSEKHLKALYELAGFRVPRDAVPVSRIIKSHPMQ